MRASLDLEPGRFEMHQLRRETVRQDIVDLPGDPGALGESGGDRLGLPGGPLLREQPEAGPSGVGVEAQGAPPSTTAAVVSSAPSLLSSVITNPATGSVTMATTAATGSRSIAMRATETHSTMAGTSAPAACAPRPVTAMTPSSASEAGSLLSSVVRW